MEEAPPPRGGPLRPGHWGPGVWSGRGALETTHSLINISRLRFSNRTHELRLRPCRGEAQKVLGSRH